MSIEQSFFSLVGLQARLASLVRQWEQQESSTAVVVSTLTKIIESKPIPLPVTTEESNMLSLVVGDALQGVNIAQKYSVFFLRMLENRILLEDFLDTFDLLQQTQKGTLAPLPAPLSHDLSFLHQHMPVVQPTSSQGWRITLQQTINQLQTIFFPQTLLSSSVFRQGLSLLQDEDDWFTLARQELVVGDAHWTMMLEGKPLDEDEQLLGLGLSIMPMEDTDMPPNLVATLNWGAYEDKAEINLRGRATFPPVPLSLVLDEATRLVKADLRVTVEALSS